MGQGHSGPAQPQGVGGLRQRQVQDLLAQCGVSAAVNLSVAAVLVAYFGVSDLALPVLAWAGSVLLVSGLRLASCRRARRTLATQGRLPPQSLLLGLTGLSGLIWGAGPWLLLPTPSAEALSLLLVTLAGMAAGAIPVLAARLEFYLCYLSTALVPIVAYLLVADQPASLVAGVAVFGVAMAATARRHAGRLAENHQLVVEKEQLARRLARSRRGLQGMLERMRRDAARDALTGLLNRSAFESALAAAPPDAGLAVCYMDLDTFKVVNDTAGHAAGDSLLRRIAEALQACLGPDELLARFGGDEFVALLKCESPGQAEHSAEALRAAVRSLYFAWEERPFRISTSLGLAVAGPGLPPGDELVRAADLACLAAKESGGNQLFVFHPEAEAVSRRRQERRWAERISRSLEEDRYELHAQPVVKVAPDRGRATYYELLVRMRGEDGSLVPPGAFLPAAERYGLASRIDAWVLSDLARRLAENSSSSRRLAGLQFAVNLSGASLSDSDFLAELRAHLVRGSLPGARLIFEITETAVIHDLPRARRVMEELRGLGCRFALDDFGQGLSSLGYLRSLPVDSLKIDGQFIRNITTDPIDRAMVDAIRRLGHAMNLSVVAEFVESEEILQVLRELGVDYAQGYHLGRPMSLDREFADRSPASAGAVAGACSGG